MRSTAPAEARLALSGLCEAYWLPIYTFMRHRCHSVHDAQDLTQGFFAEILARRSIDDVAPERGRFRSFLLAAAKNFLANERDREFAQKRGGRETILSMDWDYGETQMQQEFSAGLTAEQAFDRQWALALLDRVMTQLRLRQVRRGKSRSFEVLSAFLSVDRADISYSSAATELQMTSDAVRVAIHRLRGQYRRLLRKEIAETTRDVADAEDELKCLFAALRCGD